MLKPMKNKKNLLLSQYMIPEYSGGLDFSEMRRLE